MVESIYFSELTAQELISVEAGKVAELIIMGSCAVVGAIVGTALGGPICIGLSVKAGSAVGTLICIGVDTVCGAIGAKIGSWIIGK